MCTSCRGMFGESNIIVNPDSRLKPCSVVVLFLNPDLRLNPCSVVIIGNSDLAVDDIH